MMPLTSITIGLLGWALVNPSLNHPAQGVDDPIVLFDGGDLSAWIVPEGDNGHWKVVDGTIDYDARSEATGPKHLVTRQEFGDFRLELEWMIKETPYVNPRVKYVLPDGTNARGIDGQELNLALPDSDSGVYLRDSRGKSQINIWCWPIGSGEVYGYRNDSSMSPEVRAGVTPRHQADNPVGQWNRFVITLIGDRLTVVLNDVTVIEDAQLPGIPERGPISLQHHGRYVDGRYTSPPSLVRFRSIRITPLD